MTKDENVHHDYLSSTNLDTAAEMFIFLVFCPSPLNLAWRHFYTDLFRNFPPRHILQTLADLSKVKFGGSKNRKISLDLLSKFGQYFHLNFDKIDLALHMSSTNKDQHEQHENKTNDCVSGNNCSHQRVFDLGKL